MLLLGQKNIERVYAGGTYSFKKSFDAIADSGGEPFIAVRSGTGLVKTGASNEQLLKSNLHQAIRKVGSKTEWKKTSGLDVLKLKRI